LTNNSIYIDCNLRFAIIGLPDVCLAETHLDTLYRTTNHLIRHTLQKNYRDTHFRYQFASSNITYNTIHKRGGVGLLTVGPIVGRVTEKGADDLGRWTWQSLTAKTGKVVVVCCYQVCATSTSSTRISSASAYSQQASIVRQRGVEHPNPCAQFIHDLRVFLTKHVLPNDRVIIAGDFNESLDEEEGPIFDLQEEFNLCNAMDACVGHTSFNTYARGSSRIDFVLCSPDVLPAIRNGGYESFGHRVKGDHRPLYLDLDTELLFGNPSLMANVASRRLNSKDVTNKQLYIKFRFEFLEHRHFFIRLGKLILAEPPTDHGRH
jgi:exonuclease III